MSKKIELKNLYVNVDNKQLLKNINLEIEAGKVTVLMGPNGAGKSSISNVLMGNPKYKITSGEILFEGENITTLSTEKRAKKGLFLSFQNPIAISGVTLTNFLKKSYDNICGKISIKKFLELMKKNMKKLNLDFSFRNRQVNTNLSGGEKKKSEVLQLLLLKPKYAILDEIDSGLDVDALKVISKQILELKNKQNMGILIITHYNKILDYISADVVYVLKKGEIVEKGDKKLAEKILEKGFK